MGRTRRKEPDHRLPKRSAELREEGRRRQGRPRLRWEDCVKADVRKAEEEVDWKKRQETEEGGTEYQMTWISFGQHLTPHKEKQEERDNSPCIHPASPSSGLSVVSEQPTPDRWTT